MARNFRRPRASHAIADLNVTNLIDLGFILLVIFMIATPLIQQEQTVGVNLPSVAKAPQPKMKSDERHVAVAIDARGFYVDNQPTPLTLAQLRTRFTALAAEPKPPVIRVRGDAAVPFQKVAEVMTELQRAGLSRITIDSKTDS
ncbi:MAG: biopolymer transporter ExbD [Verrucomicrobia bacterium]|nr:biopolymer transporter ExbD [Verrucomicrobiota bacterium]